MADDAKRKAQGLAAVPAAIVSLLDVEGRPFRAPVGTIVFRPGEVCAGYILVQSGQIRVALTGATGREATLYRVGPGELCVQTFQCLVGGERYTASGTVEREVEGRMLSQAAFERQLARSEPFRRFLMEQVAQRFASLTQAVELTAFTPLPARLAAALLRHAEDETVALTHAALAAEIGSAREAVSRHLEHFARDGLVALERNRVRLLSVARLRRTAEGTG